MLKSNVAAEDIEIKADATWVPLLPEDDKRDMKADGKVTSSGKRDSTKLENNWIKN